MNGKNITTYYEADHDRLDHLFRKFQDLKPTDFPKAKEYFMNFLYSLQRHIIWEEEILFPLFEQKTGTSESGPTHVMRVEHRMIKKHLEDIHQKVRESNPDSDEEEQALLNVLSTHNQKEENILYPAIDRMISREESRSVFLAMYNTPEEKYNHCCEDLPERQFSWNDQVEH